MDKKVLNYNFSRNAATYDDNSYIQRLCAERLIDIIGTDKAGSILEVGCGTGYYTKLLSGKYPEARINSYDISPEMIKLAGKKNYHANVVFEVQDIDRLERRADADLITSNAALHWSSDLESNIQRLAGSLKAGGIVCFSLYGPETFHELKEVIRQFFGDNVSISSDRFLPIEDIEKILSGMFGKTTVVEKKFNAEYKCLMDFLVSIKRSGTRGEGLGKSVFLGKETIRSMECRYIEQFGTIKATHQVFFVRAEKKD